MPTLTVARTPTCAVLAAVLAAMRPKVILLTPRELSSFASLYEKSPAKLAANVATVPVMERADAEKKRVRRRPMALTMMPLSGGTRSGADVYRGKPLGGSAAKEAGGCCCATGGGCVFSSGNERTVRSAGRTRPVRAWERRGGHEHRMDRARALELAAHRRRAMPRGESARGQVAALPLRSAAEGRRRHTLLRNEAVVARFFMESVQTSNTNSHVDG